MGRDTEIFYCCGVFEYIFVNYTIYFQVRFYVFDFNLCFKQNKKNRVIVTDVKV
jgi:hypothetical protein